MSFRSDAITAPLGRLGRTWTGGLGPRQIGMLLAALLAAAVLGYVVFQRVWGNGQRQAPTYSVATATRQTVAASVTASGTVDPAQQVKLSFPAAGRIAQLSVKQGDTVQQGQVVAALDPTPFQIKRDTAQAQLAAEQARLQALLNGATPADIAAQQQAIASAQSTLATAQNNLTNVLTAVTPDDLAAAQAALDSAKAALDVAQTNYDKLAGGVDLTLRPEYAALQSAQAGYQTAVTNLDKLANPIPSDVAAAQSAVMSGQQAVQATQAKLDQLLHPNPADVAAAQAAVRSAQAALDAAKQKYASIYIGGTLADRQAAQAAVDAARAQLDAALTKQSSGAADADYFAAQAAVQQAQAALLQAQNNLTKVQGQQAGSDLSAAEQDTHTAEATLSTAQNNLDKLLSPAPADVSAAQQAVASALSTRDTAQSTLDKLIHPSATDLAAGQAARDQAKAALDTARTNWDRLVNKVDIDKSPEAAVLATAKSNYQSALATWSLKSQGPKPGDVQAGQSSIDSARATLTAAQAKLTQTLAGPLPTDVQQEQQAVNQMQLALQSAQNDLDNATLKAPFAGTITSVNVNQGDEAPAGGSTSVIATLLNPSIVQVDATLDEASVEKVKVGQQTLVTFDAIPGQQFQGQVAVVTPAGVTQQGVVTFPVTVAIDPRGATIPSGLTATARILTDRRDNTLAVPSRAIQRQGRDSVVQVVKPDGSLESRPVRIGLTGDNSTVEIVSGLSDGDKVAVPSTAPRAGAQGGAFGAGGLPGLGAPAPARGGGDGGRGGGR